MTTLGTWLYTWWKGERVGEDAFGNRYYRERGAPARSRRRRWVIYRGMSEASKVPAEWHGWLHHIVDAPPDGAGPERRPWQKPHIPNLTGTAHAYHPPGDPARGERAKDLPEPYQPWRP